MKFAADRHNLRPRPWDVDGALSALVRDRHARRNESALRWAEWENARDECRAELGGGAAYPPDVVALVSVAEIVQLPLWIDERMAA